MYLRLAVAAAVVALSLTACAPQDEAPDPDGTWVGTITTEGNVTTVVNESGSVWGGTARLVEEASIGVERGEDEYMLGRVAGVAAHDGRVYVVDAQVPAIRIYDRDGGFIDNLGGVGSGPGEYRRPQGVGVDREGRSYVYDIDGNRLLTYAAGGEPIATTAGLPCCRLNYQDIMTVTAAGGVWLHGEYRAEGVTTDTDAAEAWVRGYTLIRPDGSAGDILEIPRFEQTTVLVRAVGSRMVRQFAAPFQPTAVFAFTPAPAVVAGFGNAYRFEVLHADGRVTVIERAWEPVRLTSAEAQAYHAGVMRHMRSYDPAWQWGDAGVAETKPAFNAFVAAESGELWVVRDGPGEPIAGCDDEVEEPTAADMAPCWRQPRIIDVFDANGRYLGDLLVPEELSISPRPSIREDEVIAVVEDEAGTIMVKRYRLVLPGVE